MTLKSYNLSNTINPFTYSTIVTNGDFSDGTNGWSAIYCSIAVVGNTLFNQGNGAASSYISLTDTTIPAVTGDKIFISANTRTTNSVSTGIYLRVLGSASGNTLEVFNYVPVENEWRNIFGVATLTNQTTSARIHIRTFYANAAAANGKVTQIQEVYAVNLTNLFGAGKEPTGDECASIFKFTSGTKQPNFSKKLAT